MGGYHAGQMRGGADLHHHEAGFQARVAGQERWQAFVERRVHQAVEAPLRGMRRAEQDFGVRTGLIICGIRNMSPATSMDLANLTVAFKGRGVVAFDLDGKKIWQRSVGTGSGPHGWGTRFAVTLLFPNQKSVCERRETRCVL